MFSARMAETFVEEFLKEGLKYKVFRFGYETIIQNLVNLDKDIVSCEPKRKVQSMPDFLVLARNNELFFIEVKYRKNIDFKRLYEEKIKFIRRYWPETLLILITSENPKIRANYVSKINYETDLKPLNQIYPFSDEKLEKIKDYEIWLDKFFDRIIQENQ
jgi:hypothetical protein